jgi:alkyldihydroxyacetonephosphate synthase
VARIYDPFDTYVFKSGGRSHAPRTKSAGRRRPVSEFLVRRLLSRPELMNHLNHRHGDALFGRSLLVLVFEGTETEPQDTALTRAVGIARMGGGREEGEALARRWLVRRHAVSYRQPPTFARGLWVDTMEVAAPWSRLGDLYREVREALSHGGFVMAHLSHAYPDGCSIYFTFAGADPTDAKALERYLSTWERALEAAHHAGGTIAHHHGVGRSKRSAMRLELGAGVDLIDALTRAADPGSIMARGALVPEKDEGPQPVIPVGPMTPRFSLDAVSRIVTTRADTPLADLHRELALHGFALADAPSEGTVHGWLASDPSRSLRADPVDHRVAGYAVRLHNGTIARALPVPRRAAGPDLFALFETGETRLGVLDSVSLRVRGADETGPAWTAPFDAPSEALHPALASWLDRVDL